MWASINSILLQCKEMDWSKYSGSLVAVKFSDSKKTTAAVTQKLKFMEQTRLGDNRCIA